MIVDPEFLRVRVRVGALVFRGEDVLVVEHTVGNDAWHCFPGGGLEFGESFEGCLDRELHEELGISCDVGPLVAVGYSADSSTHSVELYFHCQARDGALELRSPTVTAARFVGRSSLLELKVYPLELSAHLAGCSNDALLLTRYYGRFA
jgi:ADP-ribose pyrophosphatase YjhB (NUDIX family)